MARLPLTVYLPRPELAKLEMLARQLGMARSAFASDAIRAKLQAASALATSREDRLAYLDGAIDELIALHPDAEAIRSRLSYRFPTLNQPTLERKPS